MNCKHEEEKYEAFLGLHNVWLLIGHSNTLIAVHQDMHRSILLLTVSIVITEL